MKIIRTLLSGATMFALCACSTNSPTGAPQGPNPVAAISTFTVTDLQAADADAVATNDSIAHTCYPALIQFVQSLPSSTGSTTVSGAFSAFQKGRDLRNVAAGGVPTYLTLGCGPLYAQVHADLLTFLAGVGAAGALPVLTP